MGTCCGGQALQRRSSSETGAVVNCPEGSETPVNYQTTVGGQDLEGFYRTTFHSVNGTCVGTGVVTDKDKFVVLPTPPVIKPRT